MFTTLAFLAIGIVATAKPLPQRIDWQPCPELHSHISELLRLNVTAFDCGHITVPLDYTDSKASPLELDLFKVNATQEPVLGSVLMNFGGPGATGVDNLAMLAPDLAANIGPQWNLVSWDPRGTGKTIPFDCGIDDPTLTPTITNIKRETPLLPTGNLTEYYLNYGWDLAGQIADTCYENMNETGQYIGTAFTARDMMDIVDALGEDGFLRYYGLSYGTVLGSYAAAMFPERIERMLLDSTPNPHDYQAGHWGDWMQDSDKALSAFLAECLANSASCALAQYTNATTTDHMLLPLKAFYEPLAANASTDPTSWSQYRTMKVLPLTYLYDPRTWPYLAIYLTDLLNGTLPEPSPPPTAPYNEGAVWAGIGIRASDSLQRPADKLSYLPQVLEQEQTGSFKAEYVSLWTSALWKMDAKEQYRGDFTAKTRKPILYVNGEYDPVTPLASAVNSSEGFEGSFVLPHAGYGHGLMSDPSECVTRHVRAYFEDAALPVAGTRCRADGGPWANFAEGE